jgi:hypothetical protein
MTTITLTAMHQSHILRSETLVDNAVEPPSGLAQQGFNKMMTMLVQSSRGFRLVAVGRGGRGNGNRRQRPKSEASRRAKGYSLSQPRRNLGNAKKESNFAPKVHLTRMRSSPSWPLSKRNTLSRILKSRR